LNEHVIYDGDPFFGLLIGWFLFVAIVYLMINGFKRLNSNNYYKYMTRYFIAWILPFVILFQFFTPYNSFYRLFYIIPIVILITSSSLVLFKPVKNKIFGIILIIGFVFINFNFGFIPESNKLNNRYYVSAMEIKTNTTKQDLFIFPASTDFKDGVYVRYFGERNISFFKQFRVENYPEITEKEYLNIIAKSKTWFIENYKNIYIAYGPEIL